MTAIVTFEHRGIACALPAWQVVQVDAHVDDACALALWPGTEDTTERALRVRTRAGDRCVPCRGAAMGRLPSADAMPLSAVLRAVLSHAPHVVGGAVVGGRFRWLVDADRVP